jgi:RNA recognition motif-containing protein
MPQIIINNVYMENSYNEDVNEVINNSVDRDLEAIFSQFGTIKDSDSGVDSFNSTIYEYITIEECLLAISEMNGKIFRGLVLIVQINKIY